MRTARSSAADNQCMSLGATSDAMSKRPTNAHLVKKFCDAYCGDFERQLRRCPLTSCELVHAIPCTIPNID